MNQDFASRLAQLDEHYENTAALTGGGDHPAGRYDGTIEFARIEKAGWDNATEDDIFLNVGVKTAAGMAFLNLRLFGFPSEKAMGFTKGQLKNLGHEGKLSEVPEIVHDLVGSTVEIEVSHDYSTEGNKTDAEGKKFFLNTYARKVLQGATNQGFPGMTGNSEIAPDTSGFPPAQPVGQAAPAASGLPF